MSDRYRALFQRLVQTRGRAWQAQIDTHAELVQAKETIRRLHQALDELIAEFDGDNQRHWDEGGGYTPDTGGIELARAAMTYTEDRHGIPAMNAESDQ